MYVAGLELSRYKDPAVIEGVIVASLGQPIAVYYDETRLVLRPQEIDFEVDTAAMLAEAQQYLDGPDFVDIALRKLAGIPQRRRDVPTRYSFDAQKLAGLAVAGGRRAESSAAAGAGAAAAVELAGGPRSK